MSEQLCVRILYSLTLALSIVLMIFAFSTALLMLQCCNCNYNQMSRYAGHYLNQAQAWFLKITLAQDIGKCARACAPVCTYCMYIKFRW